MKNKGIIFVISAFISTMIALIGTVDALSSVRTVTIISVFAGAFGAGASVVSAVYNFRLASQRNK